MPHTALFVTTILLSLASTGLAAAPQPKTRLAKQQPAAKERAPQAVGKKPENPLPTFADVAYGKHERRSE